MDKTNPNNNCYEIVLIGDTGDPFKDKHQVLQLLSSKLPESNNSAVIFLGDNIYPKGLPPKDHPLRRISEHKLLEQLEVVKNYKGKLIFISGNHDWNKGKKNGYEYLLRQEHFIQNYFNSKEVYQPSNGCPGPVEININDTLTLVVINTQWWVQKGYKPLGKENHCNVNSEKEFFDKLSQILEDNRNRRVLVIGHLPLYSYGIHGGKYLFKHHVFPFTIYNKKAWLPMPIVGSLLPLYRKFIGAREDLVHRRYRHFREHLKKIFNRYKNIIYAAGHEHNLQYILKRDNHYIISGAGSRLKYVIPGKYSVFSDVQKGFFKLFFYPDLSVKAQAWEIIKGKEILAYEATIIAPVEP